MTAKLSNVVSLDRRPGLRLPRSAAYWAYVALTGLQLAAFLLGGVIQHISPSGSVVVALLLLWLAAGSRAAWAILLVIDLVFLLAMVAAALSSGGGVLWGHIAIAASTSFALVATLLLPPMRRHIGLQ